MLKEQVWRVIYMLEDAITLKFSVLTGNLTPEIKSMAQIQPISGNINFHKVYTINSGNFNKTNKQKGWFWKAFQKCNL